MGCEHLREVFKARMVIEGGDLLSNQGLTAGRHLTEAFSVTMKVEVSTGCVLQGLAVQTMQRADS